MTRQNTSNYRTLYFTDKSLEQLRKLTEDLQIPQSAVIRLAISSLSNSLNIYDEVLRLEARKQLGVDKQ